MGNSTFETSGWDDQNNHAAPEGDRLGYLNQIGKRIMTTNMMTGI